MYRDLKSSEKNSAFERRYAITLLISERILFNENLQYSSKPTKE